MSKLRVFPLVGVLLALLLTSPARADSGDLDPTFGHHGTVVTRVTGSDDHAFDVAMQPDGKIVLVGRVGDAQGFFTDVGVVRYNPDGSLDGSFGVGGVVTTNLADDYDSAQAVAIQADGKILVAGVWGADPNGVALVRYLPDGSLDQSFGSGGKVLSYFSPENSGASAVALLNNGGIVVGGSIERFAQFAPNQMLLAWYDQQGSLLRSTFTGFGQHDGAARALSLGRDQTMIVGGMPGFTAGKFQDHHPDESFGKRGFATTNVRGYSAAEDMAVQPDGAIVLAGSAVDRFALVRYTSAGVLDPTFGAGGIVTTRIGDFSDATSVQVQSDGRIMASGFALLRGGYRFVTTRYMPDGSLDGTFGSGGLVVTRLGVSDFGRASVLQPDGKLVVAGSTKAEGASDFDFGVARYLP